MELGLKNLLLLILLPLSGCAGIVIYQSVPVDSPYYFQDFESAAGAGAIYAEVVGNPTSDSTVNFRQRVRRLMSGNYNGVSLRFVAKKSSQRIRNFRVVVWINPSAGRKSRNLCTYKGGIALHPDPQQLDVAMAFCNGPTLLSEASGVFFFFNVDPATTNRFKNLIPKLTAALFPTRVNEEGREFEAWY